MNVASRFINARRSTTARRSFQRAMWCGIVCTVIMALALGLPARAAGPAFLVKDIRTDGSSLPTDLTTMGDMIYFFADDGIHGWELWKSDGAVAGTVIVKDINPGQNGAIDGSFDHWMVNVDGALLFAANDGSHGMELWKSDGTSDGTALVKDIYPGANGALHDIPAPCYSSCAPKMADVNGSLFFVANDGEHDNQLWKSDGTMAGTILVKDITSGVTLSDFWWPTNFDNMLFFTVGSALWKSDGTTDGTTLVKVINPGTNSSGPLDLTVVNGTLFFSVIEDSSDIELWKSDGTADGTVLVKDINPGAGYPNIDWLTNVNGTLFFRADDGNNGPELWKSDGTTDGTALVKNISPFYLINMRGTLFFNGFGNSPVAELWKSDGTEAGTLLVKDFHTNIGQTFELTDVKGVLVFDFCLSSTGCELWRSDGTEAGTLMVQDIIPGPGSSYPGDFKVVNNTLFFVANDSSYGGELWAMPLMALPIPTPTPTMLPTETPTATPAINPPNPRLYMPLVARE
jgi:trimeric autotransporter adhesin